jgi:hypothetical protein
VGSKIALIGVGVVLGSCAWLDEPRRYYLQQEWAQLRAFDVADFTERSIGLYPSHTTPLKYRTQPCRDLPTERRITMQDGVNDASFSTQCWRSPYYNSGQRLQNRPES